MHPLFGGLEARLVGPDLPSEDDLFAFFRGDRAAEVGLFAVGDEILPALDDLQTSIFLEELRAVLGSLAIGLHLVLGHGDHQAGDVHGSGSFGLEAQSHVPVGRPYQFIQRRGVHRPRPADLDMPHAFAGAFQQTGRVVQRRTVEEADIHMGAEGVDVIKRRVSHTRRGMVILRKLSHIRPRSRHLFK